jgi:uncharacterized protein YkwD
VNSQRADGGLLGLQWDESMAHVAWLHSVDMDARGYFSHDDPDGKNPFRRLDDANIPYSTAGENIALGYETPEEAMEGWMNSPGHRANILSSQFTRLGVGVHRGDGGPWWTQMFRAP